LYIHVKIQRNRENFSSIETSFFPLNFCLVSEPVRIYILAEPHNMLTLSLNVGNFIILKLIPTNYPLWREQALALAESQDLVDHLINEDSIPNKYIVTDSTTTTDSSPKLTEEYIVWRKANRLLRGWLIGTLSEQTLGLAVGLDTTFTVLSALKNEYVEDSQEREFTLRQQVTYFCKEDDRTIGEHIRIFKGLCSDLAVIRKPILDKEKIFCLLTSLDPQYETFTTTMLKPPRPSYPKLVSQLQSLDQRRNWFPNQTNNSFTPQLAFYGQNHQRPQHHFSGNHVSRQSFISTRRGFHAQQPKEKTHTYTVRPTLDLKQK
jgi:hypothetical protein